MTTGDVPGHDRGSETFAGACAAAPAHEPAGNNGSNGANGPTCGNPARPGHVAKVGALPTFTGSCTKPGRRYPRAWRLIVAVADARAREKAVVERIRADVRAAVARVDGRAAA